MTPDAAAKHLLQHLYDARALRANPLVADVFDDAPQDRSRGDEAAALACIRNAVDAAIESAFAVRYAGKAAIHLQRQREIVLRCDMGGEADKVVCEAMSLERRQFYREKRRARRRFAEAFAAPVKPLAATPRAIAVDTAELAMAEFFASRNAGEMERAIAMLQSLCRNAADPATRTRLASLLVECFAENASWPQAMDALQLACETGASDPSSLAHVAWAKSQVARYHGTFDAVERLTIESIRHALAADRVCSRDDELLVTAHLQLAHCRDTLGRYDAAMESLDSARRCAYARGALPAQTRISVLFHLGGVLATTPGAVASAERYLTEAYAIAVQHGLTRDAAETALNLARVYFMQGHFERALEVGRAALATSRRVHGAAVHGWHCLTFTAIELEAGNPRNALALARTGGSSEVRDTPRVCYARALEASALLEFGALAQARTLAADAVASLRVQNQPRFLGYALRVLSDAAYRSGDIRSARATIDESLDLLDRFGHSYARALALKSRAVITGERRDDRNARELLDSIRIVTGRSGPS